MTVRCPDCRSPAVEIVEDNGAEYPETRVEWYRCQICSEEFRKTLRAREADR